MQNKMIKSTSTRRCIEVVITGLTRNQLGSNPPRVRISPSPPINDGERVTAVHSPCQISTTGCSAGGSAPDWGSGGRKFKSCHSDQKGKIRTSSSKMVCSDFSCFAKHTRKLPRGNRDSLFVLIYRIYYFAA